MLTADLAVAAAAVLITLAVDDPARIDAGEPTLALVWPSAALLAWTLQWGWKGGLASASVLGVASFVERGDITRATADNVVLLLIAGLVLGYAVDLFRSSQQALDRATALEAATRERERLARSIHDGVLQTLALVERRGTELGGEGAELATAAAEQQRALRALLASTRDDAGGAAVDTVDVRALLLELESDVVTVAAPADPVLLPEQVAREMRAAVDACLANVRQHVGPEAPAWVLLEVEPDLLRVTVRDEGPGIASGRLEQAAVDGRLGVSQSIRGRVEDLGGELVVTSAPGQGTELEMRLPSSAWT
jgi:signal transduction histidine kinase